MRGIYFNGKKAEYREDLIKPIRREDQSLIKVLLSAVCSTDREIVKGYRPDFKGIMGHEFVGIVEESNDSSLIGKRVVGEINEYCGECVYCKTGREHHCVNVRTPGITCNGCFTEYLVLQTSLIHIVPDALNDEVAVYTEPLAAAFEILTQIDIPKNTEVCLIGDGRLALCVANVIKLTGAKLTILGHHMDKLELFKNLGEVTTKLNPESYEIVIDASGSPTGLNDALKLVRKKGTIVMKSTYKGEACVNFSQVPVNEITIIGSRCGPFEPAIKALSNKEIVLPKLELFELNEFEKAFSFKGFKAGFKI